MAEFTTTWHRFNNVEQASAGTTNSSVLIGTGIGTASIENIGDLIRIGEPTIIDDSGTTLTFSEEIPSGAIINGVQFRYQVSSSANFAVLDPNQDLDVNVLVNGGSSNNVITFDPLGVYPYVVRTQPTTPPYYNSYNINWTTSNINDLELEFHYNDTPDLGDWFFLSNNFAYGDGSTPAVRVYYSLPPKLTITTGKLSITGNNKVNIV